MNGKLTIGDTVKSIQECIVRLTIRVIEEQRQRSSVVELVFTQSVDLIQEVNL